MAKLHGFVVWRWRGENALGGPRPATYRFSIGSCAPGEFEGVLAQVKSIPLRHREWIPAEKVWEVAAIPEVERVLAEAFENAESCLCIVHSQLRLL